MTGIGSIRFQAFNASRIREMTLSHSVATVDQEEALNGASQSDAVRLASREGDKDANKVPMSVYLSRAAQFRSQLKKAQPEETQESECPIEKARAESTTGANAPLNWLVADQYGGDTEFAPLAEEMNFARESISTAGSKESFSSQPKVASEPLSLMSDEWLLSPCA
jgi:hypothetical protein